ncbi:hypothetical protein PN836_013915 [Ningiella sp. W23]|uniref:hypothetical protein n=1 Tax=Ningiella sp. W23 TaxID=3023715 RepID=UPI003757192B
MSNQDFNICYSCSSVEDASDIVKFLRMQKVDDDNIATLSRDSDIQIADLPEADLSESSQLPDALKRGALLGSGSGLMAGLVLTAFPAAGLAVGGAAIAAMTAGGAAFGTWVAGMIGVSENSNMVKDFEKQLDSGKTLIFAKASAVQQNHIRSDIEQLPIHARINIYDNLKD